MILFPQAPAAPAHTEYVFTFHPCPRCRVDLAPHARECEFCGLRLAPAGAMQPAPVLARVRKRGRIVAEARQWRAF